MERNDWRERCGRIDRSLPVVGTGDFGKNLAQKEGLLHKTPNKGFPCVFCLAFCIFGNRGGLPFDVARYLLGLYKQRKSKKKSISEIPGAIFRKRNPNTVLPRHRHRQKPENEAACIMVGPSFCPKASKILTGAGINWMPAN